MSDQLPSTEVKPAAVAVHATGHGVRPLMPQSLDELAKLAKYCAAMHGEDPNDGLVVAKTAGIMQTGMELGLAPMTAYRLIDVIPVKGGGHKLQLNAEGQRSVIQSHPVCDVFRVDAKHNADGKVVAAVAFGRRKDNGAEQRQEVRVEDYKHLMQPTKYGNPSVWTLYTEDMLVARATTRLAKRLFADVIAGVADESQVPDESSLVTIEHEGVTATEPAGSQDQQARPGTAAPVTAGKAVEEAKPKSGKSQAKPKDDPEPSGGLPLESENPAPQSVGSAPEPGTDAGGKPPWEQME